MVLALDLGLLVDRVVEDLAVHVAEDVVADPAHDFEVAGGEHRGQHAFEQRFARLAVLPGVAGAALSGQLLNGRRRRTERRREIDVGHAQIERRDRVQRAGRQRSWATHHPSRRDRSSQRSGSWLVVAGRLGRGQIDDDHPLERRFLVGTRADRAAGGEWRCWADSVGDVVGRLAGQAGDRRAAIDQAADANAAVDGRQFVATGFDQRRSRARGFRATTARASRTSVPVRISCPPMTNASHGEKSSARTRAGADQARRCR